MSEIFNFSGTRTNQEVADSWLMHFKSVGRAAGIVRGSNGLSVWRQGAKVVDRAEPGCRNRESAPAGILIAAVHGFEELWTGDKAEGFRIE